MADLYQFKSSLIDYTYEGQGYNYTITPNDWTTIDIDLIVFGQFISLISDVYSGSIFAINKQELFDKFEIKLSEIDHGPSTSVSFITTLNTVSENDTTSAVAPSVIHELDLAKADLASPIFTGTPTAPTPQTEPSVDNSTQLATTEFVNVVANAAIATANNYADGLVINLWDDRGTFNPSSGAWPTSANGGSGDLGAIKVGDIWTSSGVGTLTGSIAVEAGDVIRALVDNASNTSTDWAVTQNNIGYTAENSTKKVSTLAYHITNNATEYPTVEAVRNEITGLPLTGYTIAGSSSTIVDTDTILEGFGKLQKQLTDTASLSALRYVVIVPNIVSNAYTVASGDVSPYGNKILKLTSAAAITVTLPNPNALSPAASVGDSFNIRQGGAGGITITGSVSGANTTTAIDTTITLIAESPTGWMSVGG